MSANVFEFKCSTCGQIQYVASVYLIVYCKGRVGDMHAVTICKYIGRVGPDGEVET